MSKAERLARLKSHGRNQAANREKRERIQKRSEELQQLIHYVLSFIQDDPDTFKAWCKSLDITQDDIDEFNNK